MSANRIEHALRQSVERYRLLVEQVKEYAIFSTNTEGRPTTWNEGVQRVLGFSDADFIGADVSRSFLRRKISRPEFRAPNRAMQGYAHLLMTSHSGQLDEEGRFFLQRISEAAVKNEALIRDLLEFGRLMS